MADYFKSDADVGAPIDQYVVQLKLEMNSCLPHSGKFRGYDQFYVDVSATQELFYGLVAKVKLLSIAENLITWVVSVATVNERLNRFRDAFDQVDTEEIDVKDLESYLTLRGLLGEMSLEVCDFTTYFLNSVHPDLHKLTAAYGTQQMFAYSVNSLVLNALELSEQDIAIDAGLLDNNESKLRGLCVVILALHKDLVDRTGPKKTGQIGQIFSLFANYFKTIYYSGKTTLFKEFVDNPSTSSILTPLFAVLCFQNSALLFRDLTNFLIYVGANYLTVSLMNDTVESTYNDEADVFFTCYLDLPTSDYKYKTNDNKSSEDDLLSFYKPQVHEPQVSSQKDLIKRHEVGLLYILNYVLKLNDMKSLVSPPPIFKREVDQLSRSLTRLLSQYMNDEKSTSLKKYGSLSGMSQLDLQKITQKLKFRSLGCIAAWGSYKEKSVSILKFLRILQNPDVQFMKSTFSLESSTAFSNLVDNLEKEDFPGKWSYYKTVHRISLLFGLLRVKMMITSLGVKRLSERRLKNFLILSEDFQQELKVKDLVNIQVDTQQDENVYNLSLVNNTSDAGKSIARLSKLQKLIAELTLYINTQ